MEQQHMIEIGYSLSCEEHPPADLVRYAQQAEEAGFAYAMISDHYHPWIGAQGQSAFVWSVIGAIAQATTRLRLGTGVTCPIIRYHPAIIAQAGATAAAMMPGRFTLGVGTGENLNEHIVGQRWPSQAVRLAMLEEAITVIRQLWQGSAQSHQGRYYSVENARLYTLPDVAPPIVVAAAGPRAAKAAGRLGDGLINYAADKGVVEKFTAAGGAGKPRYAQVNVCWAVDEAEARRTAHKICPNVALKGQLGQELATPKMFEQAVDMVSEEQVAEVITCGPDPERHIAAIQKYIDAGYDHLHIYQVGPEQAGFFRFYEREILPYFRMVAATKAQERGA
jgi:coenzyme F420-dependent glucose-6-phosphate dehydrogenase